MIYDGNGRKRRWEDKGLGPDLIPMSCKHVVVVEPAGPPLVFFLSLPSDKLQLTSLAVCPEGLSLCQCPYFLLLSLSSTFFPELCSRSVLNEGMATLGCAVTNWHRRGRWWWGGDWLSCHLLQRHELISVPQSNHTCSTCVILTLVTLYTHSHTHRYTRTHQQSLIHMPPYTSLPSPLVSMMCAAEALANCQRLSAWIRSERWRDAEGFWQRDRAQANGRLVGVVTQPTIGNSTTVCTVHVSRLYMWASSSI